MCVCVCVCVRACVSHQLDVIISYFQDILVSVKSGDDCFEYSINIDEPRRNRDMFYLTTHSTHFNLLLNEVEYIVNNHRYNQKGNPLLQLHVLLFPITSPINNKDSFTSTISQNHNTGYYIRRQLLTTNTFYTKIL